MPIDVQVDVADRGQCLVQKYGRVPRRLDLLPVHRAALVHKDAYGHPVGPCRPLLAVDVLHSLHGFCQLAGIEKAAAQAPQVTHPVGAVASEDRAEGWDIASHPREGLVVTALVRLGEVDVHPVGRSYLQLALEGLSQSRSVLADGAGHPLRLHAGRRCAVGRLPRDVLLQGVKEAPEHLLQLLVGERRLSALRSGAVALAALGFLRCALLLFLVEESPDDVEYPLCRAESLRTGLGIWQDDLPHVIECVGELPEVVLFHGLRVADHRQDAVDEPHGTLRRCSR